MAVLAIVEPVSVENSDPPITVRKHNRPGILPSSLSSASNTRIASPVWKNSAPIRMNIGMGESVKVVISCGALSAIWIRFDQPFANTNMPITLAIRKVNATGKPSAIPATTQPRRTAPASYHSMTQTLSFTSLRS